MLTLARAGSKETSFFTASDLAIKDSTRLRFEKLFRRSTAASSRPRAALNISASPIVHELGGSLHPVHPGGRTTSRSRPDHRPRPHDQPGDRHRPEQLEGHRRCHPGPHVANDTDDRRRPRRQHADLHPDLEPRGPAALHLGRRRDPRDRHRRPPRPAASSWTDDPFDDGIDLHCTKIGERDTIGHWRTQRYSMQSRAPGLYLLTAHPPRGLPHDHDAVERLVLEEGEQPIQLFVREAIEDGHRDFDPVRRLLVPPLPLHQLRRGENANKRTYKHASTT